mgnify:CR=1 FL=1
MDVNSISVTVQVVIALIGIIGSGVAVFVGLKVGMAESQKDISWINKQMDTLDKRLAAHIDGTTHPTGEQVRHLSASIEDLKDYVNEAHGRIEKKVDNVMDMLMRKTQHVPRNNE